jgi:hypothetical protein
MDIESRFAKGEYHRSLGQRPGTPCISPTLAEGHIQTDP